MLSGDRINHFESIPTYHKGFHNDDIKKMVYKPFGNTKLYTSVLGFGGSPLLHCYNNEKEPEGIETVITAVKSGINYIDTAPFYGQGKAETVLGKALKHIPRNAYYLATKIGRYGNFPCTTSKDLLNMFDFSASRTMESVTESLNRLGVDYFDVLQVHDLEYAPSLEVIINETLPTLQKIKEMGLAKYIGITGYPLSELKKVLEKSTVQIDAVLSYCRCTLFDDSLNSYLPYFKEKNMAIIHAAPVGMGLLTNNGPPDWHPAGQEIKDTCQKVAQLCKERNVDIAKLAFCHTLSQEDIHVHLIGMERKEVLKANLEALWNGLTDEELAVKKDIMNYFQALKVTHWEGKEVSQYWEIVAKHNLK